MDPSPCDIPGKSQSLELSVIKKRQVQYLLKRQTNAGDLLLLLPSGQFSHPNHADPGKLMRKRKKPEMPQTEQLTSRQEALHMTLHPKQIPLHLLHGNGEGTSLPVTQQATPKWAKWQPCAKRPTQALSLPEIDPLSGQGPHLVQSGVWNKNV